MTCTVGSDVRLALVCWTCGSLGVRDGGQVRVWSVVAVFYPIFAPPLPLNPPYPLLSSDVAVIWLITINDGCVVANNNGWCCSPGSRFTGDLLGARPAARVVLHLPHNPHVTTLNWLGLGHGGLDGLLMAARMSGFVGYIQGG